MLAPGLNANRMIVFLTAATTRGLLGASHATSALDLSLQVGSVYLFRNADKNISAGELELLSEENG